MRIVVFILSFLLTYSLHGQEHVLSNKTHFELLSIKQGLVSNSANSIVQDQEGFIWIGNFGGLSRYDGYEFKNYQPDIENPNSLVHYYVLTLYVDKKGFIWIGTLSNGLQRFDPRTETFITYPFDGPDQLDSYINDVIEDDRGNIWIGTLKGLYRLTSPNGTFEVEDVVLKHFPATIYSDTLLTVLSQSLLTNNVVAGIQQVGKNKDLKKSFSLDQATSVVIAGMGEYGGVNTGMLDYGWLSKAGSQAIIWKTGYINTSTASSIDERGNHHANRIGIQILDLEAGSYTLQYHSNEQHHYNSWDLAHLPAPNNRRRATIPSFPELWGLQVYTFETARLDWIRQQINQIPAHQSLSGSIVKDLYVDQQEQLWIATSSGVDRINTKESIPTIQQLHPSYNASLSFPLDFVSSIYERQNGTVWFSGHQLNYATRQYELSIQELSTNNPATTLTPIFHSPDLHHSIKIVEDANQTIWLTATQHSLYQVIPDAHSTYQLVHYPFVTPNANHLFIDQSEALWVGVWQEGVYKLNPSAAPFKFITTSREKDFYVTAFVEHSDGTVYFGTNNKGVFVWNPKEDTITPFIPSLKITEKIRDVHIDANNRLWIRPSTASLYVVDLTTNEYLPNIPTQKKELLKRSTNSLVIDQHDNIWMTTAFGVYCYFSATDSLIEYKSLSNILDDGAHVMLMDNETEELILCDKLYGLHILDLKDHPQQQKAPPIATYFKKKTFHCVAKDLATGNLWLGSKKGLKLFDRKTKSFLPFPNEQQFQGLKISNILPDSLGNLWLSTASGLGKYTIATGQYTFYGANSSIRLSADRSGPSLLTSWGEVLLGGENGFYRFQPAAIKVDSLLPKVQITRIASSSSDIADSSFVLLNPIQEVVLQPNQNTFEINYVGLHFDKSKEKKYKYRMKGLNDNWIEVGKERNARFTGLPPDNYTFQVAASNGDGIWNRKGATLAIKILPYWWQTIWAKVLAALMVLGATLWLYLRRIKEIKLKNQLAYEQKEAERLLEIDRLKTNFFSNITHEFRTPLTLIIEPARQLMKKWQGQEDAPTIQLIEKNSQQLLGLVNQLLDLSKLEGGKMTVAWHRGTIFDAVEPIIASFNALAVRKAIDFKVERLEEIPTFYFDKNKVQQILYNLLSNAFKFTEQGTITLSITTKKQPISQLTISVKDAGIGIGTAQLPYIFDRFYQANDTSTNKTTGTGIGLSLTKELIELMDGTIEVTSKEGAGSTFVVTLPALTEVATTEEQATESASLQKEVLVPTPALIPTKISSNKASNQKEASEKSIVLLIEDNPELRQFIRQSLEKQYTILEAENGLVGIHLAKERIPDIIISDVMMPYKDGFEVCDTLKTEEITAHIPIILLTAKSTIDSKIQGLRTGADAYLTKPFHTEELFVRIEKLIELRQKLQAKYSNVDLTTIAQPAPSENNIPPSNSPTKETTKKITAHDQVFLEKVTNLIKEQVAAEDLSVEGVANQLFISRSQLHRKLKALTGSSPNEFIRNYRLDYSLNLLKNKDIKISQVAYEVGFSDEKYFSRRFKERFGFSPSEAV